MVHMKKESYMHSLVAVATQDCFELCEAAEGNSKAHGSLRNDCTY